MGLFDDVGANGVRTPAGAGLFDDIKATEPAGDTSRGFKESFQQLPQLGYGVLAGFGAAAENVVGEGGIATGIKKAGVKGYTDWANKIAAGFKTSDSIDYSWEQAKQGDFGALVDWLQHGIGYVGGQGLQMLATAGIGAVGGKIVAGTAAKQIAEGMVAKEAAKLAATGIAAEDAGKIAVVNVASKFANIGMNTALGGAAVGMEGGEIFGGLTQQADKDGRLLSGAELGKAFGATLAAGGLEFVGDRLGLDIVLGKSRFLKPAEFAKGITGRVGRGIIAGGLQAPIEAGTEYGQTMLEEYGQGKDPTSDESLKQARESAWLGALGGAVVGGAGGAIQSAKVRPQERPITEGVDKIVGAQSADEAIAVAAQVASGKPVAPTPAERVSAVMASVDLDAVRAQYGNEAATELLTSLAQVRDPRVPRAVREQQLRLLESTAAALRETPASMPIGEVSELIPVGDATELQAEAIPTGEATEMLPVGDVSEEAPVLPTGEATELDAETIAAAAPPPVNWQVATRDTATLRDQAYRKKPDVPTPAPSAVAESPGTSRAPDVERSVGPVSGMEADAGRGVVEPAAAPVAGSGEAVSVGSAAAESGEALREAEQSVRVAGAGPTASWVIREKATGAVVMETFDRKKVDALNTAKYEAVPIAEHLASLNVKAPAVERSEALSTDIQTLKKQWQDAVRAGDGAMARRINARIIEVKNAAPYTGPTMAEVEAVQDIPTTEKMREAIEAVGEDEFTRLVEEKYAEHKPQTENQKALLVEAAAIEVIALNRRDNPSAARRQEQVDALRKKKPAPAEPAKPATNRPPKSFRKKHNVTTDVFVEASSSMEKREVDADTALKALDEDIAELDAFLKCIKG